MPRRPIEFTESFIRSLEPSDKQYVKSCRGLKIIVYPSGQKSWSLYVTDPKGNRAETPIGNYPAINVKEAQQIATKMQGEMIKEGQGLTRQKDAMRFGEYIHTTGYINWSKTNRKSHKSIMENLENIVPGWFQRKRINSFENQDFQRFADERLRDGIQNQTINRNLNNIRSVFKHATDNGFIKENPTKTFKQLKVVQAREKYAFTDDERKRLLKVARDTSRDNYHRTRYMEFFIELGIHCGLRKSEITSITWDNFHCPKLHTIDLPKEVFDDNRTRNFQTVNKTISKVAIDKKKSIRDLNIDFKEKGKHIWHIHIDGDKTKNSKPRKVPVPSHLVKRIRMYLWERELTNVQEEFKDAVMPDENLNIIRAKAPTKMGWFRDKKIIPHRDPKKAWKSLHEQAGLTENSTIHTMRHDFCTHKLRDGVDVYTIQRVAGHQDIRTTMKYVNYLNDEDFTAFDKLEHNHMADPE